MAAVSGRVSEPRPDTMQRLVYVLWFVILCDPQWWIAGQFHITAALRVPLVIVALLAITMFSTPRKGDWLVGVLAFITATAINLPFSFNRGASIVIIRGLIVYYLVGIGMVRAIRTPRAAGPILFVLCVGQYLWWAAFGVRSGLVAWHPTLDNFDGYGPLMAMGVGPGYFYATATKDVRRRTLAFIACGLCVVGVVSSFARGAVLSTVATVVYIWFRSPNKGRSFGLVAAAVLIVAVAGSLINGKTRGDDTRSNFFAEMSSSFDKNDPTANDRKVLWQAARKVFAAHPVIGVGADQFGYAAASMFKVGDVGGAYADNPNTLVGRALHNNYYQILAEYGLVGAGIYLFMIAQFFRITRALTRAEAAAAWRAYGGVDDIGKIALGIESSMVAFLLTGYFYNQLFLSWFFSLVSVAILLRSLVATREAPPIVSRRRQAFIPARA